MGVRSLWVIALGLLTHFAGVGRVRGEEVNRPAPQPGRVIERLGGDAVTEALPQADGATFFRSGEYRINTPLPEGYPAPTPPGAIEIKRYPEVRRATYVGKGQGPDGMKNSSGAFWPLFLHIKTRRIAMTAPVEIDYQGLEANDQDGIDGWSMSFLYREKELGKKEQYANIRVQDEPQVTVVALGQSGDATREAIEAALAKLEQQLAESKVWRKSGDPRTLSYNGPDVRRKNRWFEVQLPIEGVVAGEE